MNKKTETPETIQDTQMIDISDLEGPEKAPKAKKRKLSRTGVWFFRLLLALALGTAVYSGYRFWQIYAERKQGTGAYDQLTEQMMTIGADTADVDTRTQIHLDFAALEEINSDVIGWLMQDTSVINYPIVQNADNDYYLNHLFTGEWNHMGCVFTLNSTAPDFTDTNTPLFAHGRKDGTMFGTLEKYESQAYYDEHREFLLITKAGTVYLLEPFAGSINDAKDQFLETAFASEDEYLAYLQHWFNRSTFVSDVVVYPADRIVTMLTCSDDFADARYALFCKMTDVSDRYIVTAGPEPSPGS
ncbi:MAG: class B sortase [Solobacterium sp.]|nr:class B sortase [Solobacterium sp.]